MSAAYVAPIVVAALIFAVLFVLSFDTLEYQQMGLNYSYLGQSIEKRTYASGRYYLGLGNHFIKFPLMVRSVYFVDRAMDINVRAQAPSLQSRTKDGLNVRLEVSYQYKLDPLRVYNLYTTLGATYEQTLVRIAIEQLTMAATQYNAHNFFSNRSIISQEMHQLLNAHFKDHAFADVPFFQLRTVHLPQEFEDAIQETQVKQQEIQIATAEQSQNRVKYETTIVQAEQAVQVLSNQAEAEATNILMQNEAFCAQYNVTQNLQSSALAKLKRTAGWSATDLLEYMRIRAMRDHPASNSVINL